MKIAVVIVRVLMGLMFLMASITYLFHLYPEPVMTGDIKLYNEGLKTVHLMDVVKVIELICGLIFVIGRYVALAAVAIFPILFNIILFHAILGPADILIPALLMAGDLFLFYA